MKKQYNYKTIITICCLYEIIAFLTLYTHDFCDLLLFPCGLQYILLCLIFPICADNIRSNYTIDAHGSLNPKYMKDQPLYAKLIFNSITTIVLFLIGLKQNRKDLFSGDIPF